MKYLTDAVNLYCNICPVSSHPSPSYLSHEENNYPYLPSSLIRQDRLYKPGNITANMKYSS